MPNDEFPDDDNGDALKNMMESGDDLSCSRVINFSILFETIEGASKFVDLAKGLQIDAILEEDSADPAAIDVTVKRDMVPTHKSIGEFENTLADIAAPLGGRNDGWGCFSV